MTGSSVLLIPALAAVFAAAAVLAFGVVRFFEKQYEDLRQQLFGDTDDEGEAAGYFMRSPNQSRNIGLILGLGGAAAAIYFNLGVAVAAVAGGLGYFIPGALNRRAEKKRMAKLDDQFINSIGLLANALKAGESLPQAMESSLRAMEYPISSEFSMMLRQMRVGVSLEDVFDGFAKRVPSRDVQLAVQAIIFSVRTGANLPEAFTRISHTMRSRRGVQGKINTLTAQGKMQGIVVAVIPIALLTLFYFSSPGYIGVLFHTGLGNIALAAVAIMQVAAFFVIRKIVNIDV